MPANKNAVTRYYILDKLLANRYHHYSTEDLWRLVNEELAEMGISVSRRTIELDLHYLEYESPFVAEIEHYQIDTINSKSLKTTKKSCHRYADPSFSIFKKELTEDEKHLLKEALTLLTQFEGLPNFEGLENLKNILKVKSEKQILSFSKNPIENTQIFGNLFAAISQRQVIQLYYYRFDSPEKIRHTIIHPYLLKEYNLRWYLLAAAESDHKILTFALDRIKKITPLPAKKYTPFDGNINEYFEDIIGITLPDKKQPQTITFWASNKSKDYIITKPLHESQRRIRDINETELRWQYPNLEGGAFFIIECIENYELIRELTSYASDLIVISPCEIQDKVIERISNTYKKYNLVRK